MSTLSRAGGMARRYNARGEYWDECNKSDEEKHQDYLNSKNNKIKFKIGAQVFLLIFMTSLIIYIAYNLQECNWDVENTVNVITLVVGDIATLLVTIYRVRKYKRGGYNVE